MNPYLSKATYITRWTRSYGCQQRLVEVLIPNNGPRKEGRVMVMNPRSQYQTLSEQG